MHTLLWNSVQIQACINACTGWWFPSIYEDPKRKIIIKKSIRNILWVNKSKYWPKKWEYAAEWGKKVLLTIPCVIGHGSSSVEQNLSPTERDIFHTWLVTQNRVPASYIAIWSPKESQFRNLWSMESTYIQIYIGDFARYTESFE